MTDETTITPIPEFVTDDALKAGRRLQGPKLEAAKQALGMISEAHGTLDGVMRWAAYEDEEDTGKSLVVTTGPALKALGDGKVGGYLVMFGDDNTTDLSDMADWFAPDTDYDLEEGKGRTTAYYHHGMDPVMKKRKLGGRATLGIDDVGVWMEHQLNMREEYERAVYGMVEAGKMGLSSGAPPHLVEREARPNGSHKVTRWPIAEASYTPIPAEPRIRVMTMKSYLDMAAPFVKAVLPQVDALQAATADATKATPEPEQTTITTGDYDMTPEEIQALIAQTIKATNEANEAKAAAAPAINPAGYATKPAEVKEKPEAFKSLGEQLIAVRNAALGYSYDRRLDATKAILGGNESVPSEGGFLVQTEQAAGLDKKVWEVGVFASRAQQRTLAAGANSADFYGVSENSRANGSRFGGITGYRVAEGQEITASGPQKFYKYTLKPKEYAVVAYLTNEVLNDARLLEQELSSGAVSELAFMLDDDMFRGLGAAGAYGWTLHPSAVTVSKETGQAADTITYKNILAMWKRRWARGQYAWFVNQDAEDQLDLMYQAAGTAGIPPRFVTYGEDSVMRIKGAPVVVTEFNSGLGDLGDIVLADWSQYKLATIGGVDAASSMHVQFLTNQMAYRFIRRVDGQPTWQKELTPFKGTSNTISPFIMLEAR